MSTVLDVLTGKKSEPTPPVTEEVATEPIVPTEPTEPIAPTEVPTEPVVPTEPTVDPLGLLNKELGTEFKEITELKSVVEKSKTLEGELKSWEEKYSELKGAYEQSQDPLSYFANEDEYKRQQLIKTNPNLNPTEINNLFSSDLTKLKPEEILAMEISIKYPDLSKTEIKESLLKKYDYDPETDDKPPVGLVIDSKNALKELNELKTSVKLPERTDFEAQKKTQLEDYNKQLEKNRKDLEPIVNKLAESMNDLELGDGKDAYFKYQLEPEAKSEMSKQMMDYLSDVGAKIDENIEKHLADASATVYGSYFLKNHKRILDAYAAQKVAEKDEEWRAKVHNPNPIVETIPPDGDTKKPTDWNEFLNK